MLSADVFDVIRDEAFLRSMTVEEFAELRRWWTFYCLDGPRPQQFWENNAVDTLVLDGTIEIEAEAA